MAASSPPPPFEHTEKRRPNKRKRNQKGQEAEKFDLLRWNPSLSTDGDNDPFALLVGSNELDGGFLSLEEINEEDYHLQIPEPEKGKPEKKLNSKKRKHCDANKDSGEGNEDGSGEKIVEEKNLKSEKGKKKKKKKKGKKAKKIEESVAVSSAQDDAKEELVDEAEVPPEFDEAEVSSEFDEAEVPPESNEVEVPPESNEVEVPHEFDAWNELRLHPQLMKSICRLGFKEPTPIQKACIPAAAHQGKDVIGAAETGSGKTLAFGLPIMQRLLEEREKAGKIHAEKGEEVEKYGPKGHLRALIITPTRELALQVTDHLKAIASAINVQVVPIVGGMSTEKQERLIKTRPEVIVGTPGRLWELMSGGEQHLIQLHTLSFFVLDEADRMIESGHFRELQSIIDMLPGTNGSTEHGPSQQTQNCVTVSSVQRKKRQTLVFSATIALSADFRKKLKHGLQKSKQSITELNSIENLSQRAGMKANVSIVDLTNASILANKLEESFIECKEEDKDAYLYYILSVHGQGRTIVFCTSIAALRHISSLLKILGINVWTLHAQMQQRARLKAMDRFRANEHGILVATDVAARGLDIPGVRTVVHYQLPHSAEVYVHRSGRTARASTDGCSIALISPNDTSKFVSLCRSFSKESFQRFPLENSYMPEVMRRLSLARQIDKIMRKDSQEKAKKSWFERNAEAIELVVDNSDSEDEIAKNHKQKKSTSMQLKKLQQELNSILSRPLQLKTFSRNYLAGAGVSPLLQHQLETIAKEKLPDSKNALENRSRKLVIIGQDCVEPLQALRSAGHEVRIDGKEMAEKRRNLDSLRRKRKEEKKGLRDQRRKQKKRMKGA